MDPRRVRQLQQAARYAPADSSESEALTGFESPDGRGSQLRQRREAAPAGGAPGERGSPAQPSSPRAAGPGTASAPQPRLVARAPPATASQLRIRALTVIAMHLPLALLFVGFRVRTHAREALGDAQVPNDQGALATAAAWYAFLDATDMRLLGGFALLAALPALAELRDWATKVPLLLAFTAQGVVSGAFYSLVSDAPLWRLATMIAIGYLAGSLRFQWGTRRLSRRVPHSFKARVSNFMKRTAGYLPAFVVGETLGCVAFVEGGWLVISQSWFGYVLVLLFPFAFTVVAASVARALTALFGGDRKHLLEAEHGGISRLQLVRITAAVTLATVLLIGSVGYSVVTYGWYVWVNQLLTSPYAVLTEILTYKAQKAKSRQRVSPVPMPGRDTYKAYTRQHAKLISDVMSKKKEYHCH